MRQRWEKAKRLFAACVDLSAVERGALLNRECGDDVALRGEVASLLANDPGGEVRLGQVVDRAVEWHAKTES